MAAHLMNSAAWQREKEEMKGMQSHFSDRKDEAFWISCPECEMLKSFTFNMGTRITSQFTARQLTSAYVPKTSPRQWHQRLSRYTISGERERERQREYVHVGTK